jgi:hypothetical protein
MITRLRRAVAPAIFAVVVLASPVGVLAQSAAAADDTSSSGANRLAYPDMITPSAYPAHVRAIHFSNSSIDATNGTTWGAWSVTFGSQPPVATFMNNGIAQVQIGGLVCTNSIAGTFPCGMNLSPNGCAQSLGPPNTPPLLIECPESVDLAP